MAVPTPVSAVFSCFEKNGAYLNLYCWLSLFATILIAGVRSNYENDLKKIIVLSTLRQLGVTIMRSALGLPMLTLFHLYTHALFKALLFLCAGLWLFIGVKGIKIFGNLFLHPFIHLSIVCPFFISR